MEKYFKPQQHEVPDLIRDQKIVEKIQKEGANFTILNGYSDPKNQYPSRVRTTIAKWTTEQGVFLVENMAWGHEGDNPTFKHLTFIQRPNDCLLLEGIIGISGMQLGKCIARDIAHAERIIRGAYPQYDATPEQCGNYAFRFWVYG